MTGLFTDRRGGVSLLMAGALTALLGLSALAVDLGSVYLDSRRLQGIADAAALSAAGDLADAGTAARRAVTANGWTAPTTVSVETGRYAADGSLAPAARFTTATVPDSARVTIRSEVPLWFAGALVGRRSMAVVRRATAMRSPQTAFSIGTRLAAVQGGAANAVAAALTGGTVALSVADYDALIRADLNILALADTLRVAGGSGGTSYDTVLSTTITLPVLLNAVATTLAADGKVQAAAAARALAGAAAARSLRPSDLIDLGPLKPLTSARGPAIAVSAWDLAQAAMTVAGGPRQIAVDTAIGVPGLAATRLWMATGARQAASPWLTVTDAGTTIVRTAQTRLYLETQVAVAGLVGLAAVRLPIYIEMGEATARLTALQCATPAGVTLAVTPSLGHVSIAQVAPSQLPDFTRAVTEGQATLAAITLLSIKGDARIDLTDGAAQTLRFTKAEIEAGTMQRVSSRGLAGGVAASLIGGLRLTIGPLGISTGLVGSIVGGALSLAAPLLDGVIDTVTGLLGLHVGQADVRVNALRCGQPRLVA